MPTSQPGRAGLVLLNQELVVRFSEPIDPSTVTNDSVRVLDEGGHPVAGQLRCGSRSLRFSPIPPVTRELRDGSLSLGGSYRLEIIGWPTSYGIRSRAGRPLEHSLSVSFEVPRDPTDLGFPSPFVPVGVGEEPFTLDVSHGRPLRMAADEPVLDLHFTLPPRPDRVTADAFVFVDLEVGSDSEREIIPESVVVLAERSPWSRHYGSTVRVRFRPDQGIEAGDDIYLMFRSEPDRVLRDYGDRPLVPSVAPLKVEIDPGSRARLKDFEIASLDLEPMADVGLGFELADGRIRPRARIEAGTGRDGDFHPTVDTVLDGSTPREDGSRARELHFRDFVVPADVTVRLVGAEGLRILVTHEVRIEGRIVLEDAARAIPWTAGEHPGFAALVEASGVAIVTAGRIVVAEGAVLEHVGELMDGASPCTLIAAAGIQLGDRVPPRTVVAVEEGATISGRGAGLIRLAVQMTSGVPEGTQLRAGSWTGWLALPPQHIGRIEVLLDDPDDGLQGWLQAAEPSSVGGQSPLVAPRHLIRPIPLPLREPLDVRGGAFVRIGFTAEEVGPGALPSAAGFRLYERDRPR